MLMPQTTQEVLAGIKPR